MTWCKDIRPFSVTVLVSLAVLYGSLGGGATPSIANPDVAETHRSVTLAFAGQSNAENHFKGHRSDNSYRLFENVLESTLHSSSVTAFNTADGGRAADIQSFEDGKWHWDPDANEPSDFLLRAAVRMKIRRPDGIIWAQGEADARSLNGFTDSTTTPARFEEATREIFDYIRTRVGDPNLPIFIQEVGALTDGRYVGGVDTVRAIQKKIADDTKNVFIAAKTTDLPMSKDGIHFSNASYRTIATRLAEFVGLYFAEEPGSDSVTEPEISTKSERVFPVVVTR